MYRSLVAHMDPIGLIKKIRPDYPIGNEWIRVAQWMWVCQLGEDRYIYKFEPEFFRRNGRATHYSIREALSIHGTIGSDSRSYRRVTYFCFIDDDLGLNLRAMSPLTVSVSGLLVFDDDAVREFDEFIRHCIALPEREKRSPSMSNRFEEWQVNKS